MKGRTPNPKELQEIKKRHNLTYAKMVEPLYGVPAKSMANWVRGERTCPAFIFWALKLVFDKIDLRRADVKKPLTPNCLYCGDWDNGCIGDASFKMYCSRRKSHRPNLGRGEEFKGVK